MSPGNRQPRSSAGKSVAIIGAGIAGLTCARELLRAGLSVEVFEKSRGVGGRMATRRAESLQFDHGTQYFTVRDRRFRAFIDQLTQAGVVQRWDARVVILRDGRVEMEEEAKERFVGVPKMNAICRHLAQGISVRCNTRVAAPQRRPDGWLLQDDQLRDMGVYDFVLFTAPAPQTAELLPAACKLDAYTESARMLGCWAAMFAFADPLPLDFDAAFVVDSPVNWLAHDGSNPRRNGRLNTWVVHASAEWSAANIDRDAEDVGLQLFDAFLEACGVAPRQPLFLSAHRWRYALAAASLATGALYDAASQVGAAGDWCAEPRVEGAYISGLELAERLLVSASATCSDSDT